MREPAVHLCTHFDGPVHLPQQQQLVSSDITGHYRYQQRLHASAEICCGKIALMARPRACGHVHGHKVTENKC